MKIKKATTAKKGKKEKEGKMEGCAHCTCC